jgi:two-component system KDP operon response regulator KdpE
LVVDDEPRMIGFIRMNLEIEGHQIIEARNGYEALEYVRTKLPDLILLDVMMPELDGFETLRMIREFSSIPVIMLTAKGEENDKVYGLELGADDYVAKPFGPRELSSRIKAVLRRFENPSTSPNKAVLKIDDRFSIDFNRREVIIDNKHVKLRPTEYRLLYHLVEKRRFGPSRTNSCWQKSGDMNTETKLITFGYMSIIFVKKLRQTPLTRNIF